MISLKNKRILVTQAEDFMGPAICQTLNNFGADVIASRETLIDPDVPAQIIGSAGDIDALIVNLAVKAPTTPVDQVSDAEWQEVFRIMVDPLPRLTKAVVPGMRNRGGGKIVVIGSAAALRGQKRSSSYSAARGAQLAYVQAAGVELARDGICINAIAQNFVDNPTYFPKAVQQDPRFQERLKREVPLGRLVSAQEDASLVAYLCSDAASCFVGQVFPVAGGWVAR